jgi:Right handed beta helix region/TIR domain
MSYDVPAQQRRVAAARRRIESFARRFGDAHRMLACHAAFPLSLTPDLLYCLWANFQRDADGALLNIPWVAVSDLLLSILCEEAGHELYQMDKVVRQELLAELTQKGNLGQRRLDELSRFLSDYVHQQLNSPDQDARVFAQAQQWMALAYRRPQEAAHQMADTLTRIQAGDHDEQIRMSALLDSFAQPLKDYSSLIDFARGMADLSRGRHEQAATYFGRAGGVSGDTIEVADVSLRIPTVQGAASANAKQPTTVDATATSWPSEEVTRVAEGPVVTEAGKVADSSPAGESRPETVKLPPRGYISFSRSELPPKVIHFFLSYLTDSLRKDLTALTGEEATLFLDLQLLMSKNLLQRLDEELANASFFIPVLTKNYFNHRFCRSELERFLARSRLLQHDDLIFPIYFTEELPSYPAKDWLAQEVLRHHALRFPDPGKMVAPSETHEFSQRLRQLVSNIAHTLGVSGRQEAPPPLPPGVSLSPDPLSLDEQLKQYVEILRSTPIFRTLTEDEAHALAADMERTFFVPGQVMLEADEDVHSMFFIAQGTASRREPDGSGGMRIMQYYSTGQSFNEYGLLLGQTQESIVSAGPNGALGYWLHKPALNGVIHERPALVEEMANTLAQARFPTSIFEERNSPEILEYAAELSARIRAFYDLSPAEGVGMHPQKTLVVARDGGGDFRRIKDAIEHAAPHDRVLIRPGTYFEALDINKSLQITSDEKAEGDVVLDASREKNPAITFHATRGNVRGIKIRHRAQAVLIREGTLYLERCAIAAPVGVEISNKGHGFLLQNNISLGNVGVIIRHRGEGRLYRNNIFVNEEAGIVLLKGTVQAQENYIQRNGVGVIVRGGKGSFKDNDLRNNKRGAWIIPRALLKSIERVGNIEFSTGTHGTGSGIEPADKIKETKKATSKAKPRGTKKALPKKSAKAGRAKKTRGRQLVAVTSKAGIKKTARPTILSSKSGAKALPSKSAARMGGPTTRKKTGPSKAVATSPGPPGARSFKATKKNQARREGPPASKKRGSSSKSRSASSKGGSKSGPSRRLKIGPPVRRAGKGGLKRGSKGVVKKHKK